MRRQINETKFAELCPRQPRAGVPMECPVCFDTGAREVDSAGGVVELDCKRCGPFRYGGGAWEKLKKAPENKRAVIASRLWDQNRFGSVPTIDESNVDALLSMQPLPFLERAKRLLIDLAEQSDRLGKPLQLSSPRLDAMVGTLVHNDLAHINQFLLDRGWIEDVVGGYWKVTGGGLISG